MMFVLVSALRASIVLLVAFLTNALLRNRSAALRHTVLAAAMLSAATVPLLTFVVPSRSLRVRSAWIQHSPLANAPEVAVQPATTPVHQVADAGPTLLDASNPAQIQPSGIAGGIPRADVAAQVSDTGEAELQEGDRGNSQTDRPFPPTPEARPSPEPLPVPPSWEWRGVIPYSQRALAVVWLVGMAVAFVGLGVGWAQLVWIVRKSEWLHDGIWVGLANEAAAYYRLPRPVRILQSREESVLAVWGVLRPALILPAGAAAWPEDRVRAAVYHELAHIKRGDWLVQIVAEIQRAVYWFNPLQWMACSRLVQESEQACDDAALSLGIPGSDYAAELLEITRSLSGPRHAWLAALWMASPSTLERRFKAMLNPRLNRSATTRFSTVATAATFLLLTIPVVAVHLVAPAVTVLPIVASAVPAEVAAVFAASAGEIISQSFQETTATATAESGGVVEGVVRRTDSLAVVADVPVHLRTVADETTRGAEIASGKPWSMTVQSDADGRFRFTDVPPGRYAVRIPDGQGLFSKPIQFLPHFTLAPSQHLSRMVEAIPGGSITGRVVDSSGSPLVGATLYAAKLTYRDGERRFEKVTAASVTTNSLGEYRFFWLPPDRYYLFTEFHPSTGAEAPRVYYPGTLDDSHATPVVVPPGKDVVRMDFALVRPPEVPLFTVSGRVNGAPSGVTVRYVLVPASAQDKQRSVELTNAADPVDGAFHFRGIASGAYELRAFVITARPPDNLVALSARSSIEIGHANVSGLALDLLPGVDVRVRVFLNGRQLQRQEITSAVIDMEATRGAPLGSVRTVVDSAQSNEGMDEIVVRNIPRGTYIPKYDAQFGDTYVSDIRQRGASVAGNLIITGARPEPIDVFLNKPGGGIMGMVSHSSLNVCAFCHVIAVQISPAPGVPPRRGESVTNAEGRFEIFQWLPPGEYRVFAWDRPSLNDSTAVLNKDFIQAYERFGYTVTVVSGKNATVQIQAITDN